jgi:hypothetical protein
MRQLSRLLSELKAILSSPIQGNIILMDDARVFLGGGQKLTAAESAGWIEREFPGRKVEIARDIFRVTQRRVTTSRAATDLALIREGPD